MIRLKILSISSLIVLIPALYLKLTDFTSTSVPGNCSTNPLQLQCGNGTCVPFSKFRDCVQDCNDGVDEDCPPLYVKCDGCKCVEPTRAKLLCYDVLSQKWCNSTQIAEMVYQCQSSSRCILKAWFLDGVVDCPLGEDENGTDSLNSFKTAMLPGFASFAASFASNTYIRDYLITSYTPNNTTVLGDVRTAAEMLKLATAYVTSNGTAWPTMCPAATLDPLIMDIARSTPRCVLYWQAGSNVADLSRLPNLLALLSATQCRVDILLVDHGCFNTTSAGYSVFNSVADYSGGLVHMVSNASSSVRVFDIFLVWALQQMNARIKLEKQRRPTPGFYTSRFTIDKSLTDLLVIVQGCGLATDVRDNRGFYASTFSNTTSFYMPVVKHGMLSVHFFQLTNSMVYNVSGPGYWLLTVNSSCAISYEISATGMPDFNFTFSPGMASTFASLSIPILDYFEEGDHLLINHV
uniref:Uncharacterized protein n=1 Tax=Romanomermis culicivorax TaxID=13658 RepID=A0A915LB61_ROMCU